ncbi:MAG: hypothetical protein VX665_09450 [Pseudomonadota bacterium]|nr:hypothetical protein [Pseudomonadota bacterium]MEC8268791.1 hypothetical protein [Pseudomonadota bacterium]MED5305752.1 hypothetical protein [Pseudomonadota bacterium]
MNGFLAEHGALIGALVVTCVITAGTPGPNNFIVLTARLSDSTKAALKAYLGVCLGFPFMVFTVSLIVAHYGDSIIEQLTIVKYLGIAFVLYLSAKLFLAPPSEVSRQAGMAPGFIFVVLFQWTNPKAWAMASSTAVIAGPDLFYLPALIYLVVIFPCVGVWFWFGDLLKRRILGTPWERYLNRSLAVLLALSVLMMI